MKIHHIGYVVKDINQYLQNLHFTKIIAKTYDQIQQAELILLDCGNVYIELIQPTNSKSFTYAFLQKNGNACHHICYEINDKNQAEQIIIDKKMIKVLDWVYAPLLQTEVVFAYNRNKEVVEFAICQN